jgi:hypothetical protein
MSYMKRSEGLRIRNTLIFPSEKNQLPQVLRSSLLKERNHARSVLEGYSHPQTFTYFVSRIKLSVFYDFY